MSSCLTRTKDGSGGWPCGLMVDFLIFVAEWMGIFSAFGRDFV